MIQALFEPLQYSFMQRSLVIAIIVGLLCAVVGSYLMVQRLALLGDAISHSVLPGLAIAFILGGNIYFGAFIAGVVSTIAIAWIKTRSPIKEDAAMGIVLSAFFALGITLITVIQKNQKIDLNHFLFGNILGVTSDEVRDTAIIGAIVLIVIFLLYKELLFYTFDPLGAQAAGLPVNRLNFGLMLLIALTIVASMKTVGVVLVLAMLITPGATAYLLVKRLNQVMILGGFIGVISSISGMYLSYFYNLPSGPAIVLVASGLFVLALLFGPRHGIFTPKFHQKS
ncbi:metal ABC transporter permease [Umezakia ovalisporum]|jgi:manganese/iron transport system permease protein|uniref:Metal ABC transporter permease n=1 Tax=Umezakia ovalisporum FSS-43 TaxID=2740520 RepID=A0ABT6K5D0_9CYAN|nr:metal ABC transporter permease [Umezakia ovalisporum]MBI1242704.1 iron chelate uptake ABC transporter family permease subunit [Nostoc sp. RI_552]MDH6057506.1 metal ABC transporter permease [Umezakia ovalisporum FSS-43]MDH6066543.1 metal ABC transporter permease [Umezakia ovalisporum APH033B]MDH6070973.1 metal ABC transporter permease [Umezakia ovalisporum CobakiLakeA]MDH6073444.1 metal ABC transporter permease [Umezakia ovalisporum CS-1034]